MGWFGKKKEKEQAKENPTAISLDRSAAKAIGNPEREETINGMMSGLCVESFPDNALNRWHIKKTLHFTKYSFVMIEPDPKDVGYDLLLFVVRFSNDQPARGLAVFCLDQASRFTLLSTMPGCPKDIPNEISWSVDSEEISFD